MIFLCKNYDIWAIRRMVYDSNHSWAMHVLMEYWDHVVSNPWKLIMMTKPAIGSCRADFLMSDVNNEAE